MNIENITEQFKKIKTFVASKNYYFDDHICLDGKIEKLYMDNTLSNDNSDSIVRYGICPKCGTCLYHNDFKDD